MKILLGIMFAGLGFFPGAAGGRLDVSPFLLQPPCSSGASGTISSAPEANCLPTGLRGNHAGVCGAGFIVTTAFNLAKAETPMSPSIAKIGLKNNPDFFEEQRQRIR